MSACGDGNRRVDEDAGDVRACIWDMISRNQPVPIQEIQDEEKKITIQGAVFGLDRKELRNGNDVVYILS